MYTLNCNCGHSTKGSDRYLVEGEMWAHAFKDHKDMLLGMKAPDIAQWLRDKDKTLGVAAT